MPPHAGTPSNSNTSLPLYHSVLLSISGDSKISLQHTSVQQLSAIPEDRELVDVDDRQQQQQPQQDGTFTPQMIIEDEFDEPHILIQDPAPDGGYGWVVVMASFFCNLIVDGIAYTFGLFFEIFVAHFGVSKSKVALCGSILNGFYLSVGPLVSALANRFGCRIVTIMGAIIAFLAFSLSTIAPNIETLYITYGFFGGVGMGMIFLPAIVSVGYYFTTKRAFATGIAVCGSGVGTFLFAPFCQYLLGVTTWQNTLLILAFMILLCAGFGGLMRPLNVHAKTVLGEGDDIDNQEILDNSELRKPLLQRIAEEKRRRLLAHSNSQFLLMMQHGSLDLNDLTFTELKNRLNSMNMEPGVHSTLYLDQLFQPPTPQPQTPTPSVAIHNNNNNKDHHQQQQQTSTCPSTTQSQSQLCTDQKHQLSPIIESKKIFSVNSSEDSSGENITIKENDKETNVDVEQQPNDEQSQEQDDKSNNECDNKKIPNAAADAAGAVASDYSTDNNDDNDEEEDDAKSEMTTPTSAAPESPSTLPQSPLSEISHIRSYTMASNFVLHPRSRRSTVRTVSESGQTVDSSNCLPSSSLLPQINGMGTSGQLPIQVILSSTPAGASLSPEESKDKRTITIQAIPVRPLSKKDIFYSGSTLHAPSSMQHLAESGVNIGQSIVSIPARDIIAKVQKQIQQQEAGGADDDDDGLKMSSYQKKNVCDKILRVLCSFKDNCCQHNQQHQHLNNGNNNIDDQNETGDCCSEMNSLKQRKFQQQQQQQPNDDNLQEKQGCWNRSLNLLPPSMKSILNEMLDFSLLRDSNAFTILAISNIFGMMGFYVPFVYITQFATSSVMSGDKLVTPDQSAILISVIGITNTFGRLLFGFLTDHIARNGSLCGLKITALDLNNICVILSGLSVIAAPYCTTYFAVIIDCVLFGLFISAYICLTSVILVDMLGLERLTNAFGLLCLFRGAASLIGPPLAGALFDMTQSYHITFAASGILLIISSIMAFFVKSTGDRTVEQESDNECDV
ncbi:hypothetical protein DERP_012374 [Dermatophagoides pteronyssinus]|uniref:Major facilitator superfamily (MFS) profile domain-containing protein n=1 Tax=Dermatophagoides pteronyssinus TaxID=6956 RepID=A0ABQ8IUV8_DERPT|nr:hypothetical protein DERP_012374 [Dermatophagoides pteronyssinus]